MYYRRKRNDLRMVWHIIMTVFVFGALCYLLPVMCSDGTAATVPMALSEVETVPVVDNSVETVEIVTVEETAFREDIPYYTVNGKFLGYELSNYLYEELESRRMEWFYEIALCQLYQESRFDPNIVSPDGYDQGIAQLRSTYFEYFMELAGLMEADPFNPYDSIFIYVHLMCDNLRAVDGDIPRALSKYNVGNFKWYNEKYVNAVLQWVDTVEPLEVE